MKKMNNSDKKKTAAKAATSETVNTKIKTINSILKNGGNVKVLIKRPGEKSAVIHADNLPPEFLSKKLMVEPLGGDIVLVHDDKSRESVNLAVSGKAYRGTVVIAVISRDTLFQPTVREIQSGRAWLLRHRV